jgi:hypothetical protein
VKLLKGKRLKSVLLTGNQLPGSGGALSSEQVNISSGCWKKRQEGDFSFGESVIAWRHCNG